MPPGYWFPLYEQLYLFKMSCFHFSIIYVTNYLRYLLLLYPIHWRYIPTTGHNHLSLIPCPFQTRHIRKVVYLKQPNKQNPRWLVSCVKIVVHGYVKKWVLPPQCSPGNLRGRTESLSWWLKLKLKDWSIQRPCSTHVQVVTKQYRESQQMFPEIHRYQVERKQRDRDRQRHWQRVQDTQAHRETASFIIFCSTFDNDSGVLHFHPLDVRRSLF